METEWTPQKSRENDLKPEIRSPLARALKKPNSPLKMRYQAEVALIKKDLESLEKIRFKMGLSRRKMCELLLVDPSAWTRWTRDESKVPPHVWKTLSLLNGSLNEGRSFPQLDLELRKLKQDLDTQVKKTQFKALMALVFTFTLIFALFWIKY